MDEKANKPRFTRRKNKGSLRVNALTEAQKIAFAPFSFQVVAAMLDFNILQELNKTPMTREQIIKKCGVTKYTAATLLEAALCIGLVEKDEELVFSTTPLSEAFLFDSMTKVNFNFVKDVCYLGASELKNSFAKQEPVGLHKFFFDSKTIYPMLTQMPEQMKKSWYEFDHHYSDDCFDEVLKIIFENNPSDIFDIGGNTGKFERACLSFNQNCCVNMIDLGENIEAAKKNFDSDRIKFHSLDILEKENNLPLMKGNEKQKTAVFMSQFLDCFSEDQIISILNKVAEVSNEFTRVYILEPFIDNQQFDGARYSLSHISLYFTCMANGCSRMYNEADMLELVEKSGLKLLNKYNGIGKYDYTLLECIKK